MDTPAVRACTAFLGTRQIAAGPPLAVALALKAETDRDPAAPVQVFDDDSGRPVEFDLRGTPDEVRRRTYQHAAADEAARGRGRPRLGVVAREVTLLPRHWDWLAAQPGGASAALRRLVDAARRADASGPRVAAEAAYRFMSAMAGNEPGFEEAARALFAGERDRFAQALARWPADVRDFALRLAGRAFEAGAEAPA